MKRTDTSDWPCTIARASVIFGQSWNLLILREAFYGNRRFDQLQKALGIGRNILTERLSTLIDEGLFTRDPYQEHPTRYEYLLTDKGRDTFPVLLAMATWGRAHTLGRLLVLWRAGQTRRSHIPSRPRAPQLPALVNASTEHALLALGLALSRPPQGEGVARG
jgi:DNA-binding HxlR family transcriptional regulator